MKNSKNYSNNIFHIAIDGPVASGKGTVAKLLAARLNIPALDTGAMYRAVAVWEMDGGEDLSKLNLEVKITDGQTVVFVDGKNVTERIRDNEISKLASDISVRSEVRAKLTLLMQEIAKRESFILEGRDISSVVLPDARFKFYLTASPEVRARRRFEQLSDITFEQVLKQVNARDAQDKTRDIAPLIQVKDAIVIDNSDKNIDETLQAFCDTIQLCLN